MNKELWENIVDGNAPDFSEWVKYFTDSYPVEMIDLDIEKRFLNPLDSSGKSDIPAHREARTGIVFHTLPDGRVIPAGILWMQSDGKTMFVYHEDYIGGGYPAIYNALPLRTEPYVVNKLKERPAFLTHNVEDEHELIPCLDNIIPEGWRAGAEALAIHQITKEEQQELENGNEHIRKYIETLPNTLSRLLAFGRDSIGATWYLDIDRDPDFLKDIHDNYLKAVTTGRATITGSHPKLTGVLEKDGDIKYFRPTGFNEKNRLGETSTHILKLYQRNFPTLLVDEYLAMQANAALMPEDKTVGADLGAMRLANGKQVPVLAIERFDRTPHGGRRNFEELNTLIGKQSGERDKGSYKDMSDYLNPERKMAGSEYNMVALIYKRLLANFILGNVDNHLKNFAVFPAEGGGPRELTPNYDLDPVYLNKFKKLILKIDNKSLTLGKNGNLKSSHLVKLGLEMGIAFEDIRATFQSLEARRSDMKKALLAADIDEDALQGTVSGGLSIDVAQRKALIAETADEIWEKSFANYALGIEQVKESLLKAGPYKVAKAYQHIVIPELFPHFHAQKSRNVEQQPARG